MPSANIDARLCSDDGGCFAATFRMARACLASVDMISKSLWAHPSRIFNFGKLESIEN